MTDIFHCNFCKKIKPKKYLKTLISYSESGAIIYSLICEECIKYKSFKAIDQHDKILDNIDKNMRFYDLS